MKKLLSVIALVLLTASCGGGGDNGDGARGPGDPENGETATRPEDVKAAPADGANRPTDGTYIYTFSGRNVTQTGETSEAPQGATFTSEVTNDGNKVTFVEKTSMGRSTSTTVFAWTDDKISELEFKTVSSAGSPGCVMTDPIPLIEFPLKSSDGKAQEYEGTGVACDRTKTVTIVGEETVTDAAGRDWHVWRVNIETEARSTGLTEKFQETKWFSADLGKDIQTKVITIGTNKDGAQLYRAETNTLLESYPS